MRSVLVVGGGAAGMMAAVAAAEEGCRVTLLEQNEKLRKKLYLTGKGRCNVTNAGEDFFAHLVSNGRFLHSSFARFDNRRMTEFLEREGLRLKAERGNRVFPVSDKSSDVIRTLSGALARRGVEVRLRCAVRELAVENGVCTGAVAESGERFSADRVILATGGLSYPSTGSTGAGHRMAAAVGHRIVEPVPALTALEVKERDEAAELQGLSLRNVNVRVCEGKRAVFSDFGEMLFTHFGVSGPCILRASSRIARRLQAGGGELRLYIDLKPALTPEQLAERIRRDLEETPNRNFGNSLGRLLPSRLTGVIVRRSGIDPERPAKSIAPKERRMLAELLKRFEWTLTGTRGFAEAVITQGGVCVTEVDPATMESRLVRGLYIAGELLDVDAETGGYNLQIAWSTGYAAGKGAGNDENRD